MYRPHKTLPHQNDDALSIQNLHLNGEPIQGWLIPSDILFVSGSRIEGFGNPASDADFFWVYSALEEQQMGGRPFGRVSIDFRDSYHFDLTRYSSEEMSSLYETINSLDPSDFPAVQSMTVSNLDLYYRTAIGVQVVNANGFTELQEHFNHYHFCKIYETWTGLRAAAHLVDAETHKVSTRMRRAYLSMSQAVDYATDSYLARHGEAYPSEKWRFEKAKRRFGEHSNFYERAWNLKAVGERSLSEYWVLGRQFCRDLGMDDFPGSYKETSFPRRARGVLLFPLGTRKYLIRDKSSTYEIDKLGAQVWQLLDGETSLSDVAARLADHVEGIEFPVMDKLQKFVTYLNFNHLIEDRS